MVGAAPRWVQNALAVLGSPPRYTEEAAQRLALARLIHNACGMPLVSAYPLAARALSTWPGALSWEQEGPEATVTLAIDLERFLSNFAARLSLSRLHYAERRRGRPRKRARRGIPAARAHGLDLSLLESSLRRTTEERLRALDADIEFLRSLKVVGQ